MHMYLKNTVHTAVLAGVSLAICSCSPQRLGPAAVDPDAPSVFTTTDSGLKYRILRKSAGGKPKPSDQVKVDYSGWLDDGTVFDSSYERKEPATFGLTRVVRGWTEGLQLIGEGGMIELEIPAELGYGAEGKPPTIPPNSTLHFKVELLRIE
jgi:FKBP-type peptidyl-prolyl cis-trans isomerase